MKDRLVTTICTEACLNAGRGKNAGLWPSGLLAVNWPILLEVAVIRPCGAAPAVPCKDGNLEDAFVKVHADMTIVLGLLFSEGVAKAL